MVRSLDGAVLPAHTFDDGSTRLLRLTTWLDGDVWARAIDGGAIERRRVAASLGALLGRLDLALRTFEHPAARRHHRWDLARAGDHLDIATLIDDPDKRAAVETVLHHFVRDVAPRLSEQPRQIVHNDANDYNVLLDANGDVSGLIDFGDIVETWRINEVAIVCAYAMIGASDPIGAVLPLVAAYHDESPLTEIEAEALFDLVATRYAVSICLAAKQIANDPTNQYLLISQRDVWDRLQHLLSGNRRVAIMRFRAACRFEAVPQRRHVERWLEREGHRCGPIFDRPLTPETLPVLDLSVDDDTNASRAGRRRDDLRGALRRGRARQRHAHRPIRRGPRRLPFGGVRDRRSRGAAHDPRRHRPLRSRG